MRPWANSWARWLPVSAVLVLSVLVVDHAAQIGEYRGDAEPAVNALVNGHLQRFLDVQPLMGSFAVLARVPFVFVAKLAGAGELGTYQAGALFCLLAAAAVGIALVRLRPDWPGSMLLVPALAVLTPASLEAVRAGHPEEMLGGALCVAAVLLAGRRSVWAAVALGLAVATKQWAVLAVAPVVLAAAPRQRWKLLAIAAAVAILLAVPLLAGNPSAFVHRSHQAQVAPSAVVRATVWFVVATPHRVALHLGPGLPTSFTTYRIPHTLAQLTHPLIVLLSPLLALLAWRRRGNPLALLALLLLLRCVLDPADNEYYHAPFLLALLAYETVQRREWRGLPLVTLFSCAGLWLTFDLDVHGAAPAVTNAVYLAWTLPVLAWLSFAAGLVRQPSGGPVETPSLGASAVPGQAPQSLVPAARAASASRMSSSA